MRKFNRAGEPAVVQANCTKWNTQWVASCGSGTSPAFKWYTLEGKTAREHFMPALREQTQRHCSFCDGFPIEGVSNETVEHFKPKTKFPEHAYTWANLYYCCNACQSAKREHWDSLLLHADAEDYSFARYFEFDFTTGQIRPNSLAAESDKQRAEITIRLYGLDSQSRRRNRQLEARKCSRSKVDPVQIDEYAYRDFIAPAQT